MPLMPPHQHQPSAGGWSDRRADARRNHERIVAAAIDVFTERGLNATIPEIAARAGVGKATVYRSYPTKADLIEAIARHHFSWLEDRVVAAAGEADAFGALQDLIVDLSERLGRNRILADILPQNQHWNESSATAEQFAGLLGSAQRQGRIRPDATLEDIRVLMGGYARVLIEQNVHDPAHWRRYATLILNALRP